MITSGENEILAYAEAQGVAARVIPFTKFSVKTKAFQENFTPHFLTIRVQLELSS